MLKKIVSLILLLCVLATVLMGCQETVPYAYTDDPYISSFNIEFDFDRVYDITESIVFIGVFNLEKEERRFIDHSKDKKIFNRVIWHNDQEFMDKYGRTLIYFVNSSDTILINDKKSPSKPDVVYLDINDKDYRYDFKLTILENCPENEYLSFIISVYNEFEKSLLYESHSIPIYYKVKNGKVAFSNKGEHKTFNEIYKKLDDMLE